MARLLITGSSDGLGLLSARSLMEAGHRVVVHIRSHDRRPRVEDLLARGADLVVGELSDLAGISSVADQVNALGRMEGVIHNAGVYTGPGILPVNVVAPYLLTCRLPRPERLITLSSGLHLNGRPRLDGLDWSGRRESATYADSKLFVTALTLALARSWPEVKVHAVNPGWVPTRMGGPHATDDLRLGHLTQEWLATSSDPEVLLSGGYWYHQKRLAPHKAASDPDLQERLLAVLREVTGESLPR